MKLNISGKELLAYSTFIVVMKNDSAQLAGRLSNCHALQDDVTLADRDNDVGTSQMILLGHDRHLVMRK